MEDFGKNTLLLLTLFFHLLWRRGSLCHTLQISFRNPWGRCAFVATAPHPRLTSIIRHLKKQTILNT